MITIFKTKSMKNAAEYVSETLKHVDGRDLTCMHTVIVPDRASLEAERALLQAVCGSFNVQVRTFRRLANEILPAYNYLSKQAGIMALTGIIQEHKSQLLCFTKGVETEGFVSDMYDTISMMKYCKITPQMLLRDDLPKSVQSKAHDIAVLYQGYLDFTTDRFIDSADKMNLLCEEMPKSDVIKNGYFYLYDFDNFSAQELSLVEQLMLCSQGVTVACCVGETRDRYLYLNDIYEGVLSLCKRNGLAPNIVPDVNDDVAFKKPQTRQIAQNMFRYDNAKPVESHNFVEIFEGSSRVEEVYALACKIQQYVRSGKRYKDVYVVTSDINKYSNAITSVFEQFDIPYFCDTQFNLCDHPYARYVLDYLALCRNNAKLSYVLSFVKNHLFCGIFNQPTTTAVAIDEDVFHFENYCLKYNASYNFDRFNLGKDEPYFEQANNFRKKFNALYKKVTFAPTATVSEYVEQVRQLIDASNLNEKNSAFAEQQKAFDLTFESKVTTQAQQKFEEVLAQAEIICGERSLKLDDFIKMLTVAVSSVKISVIPVKNDCVVFANMAKARKHDIKFLALLGANFGVMPIIKGESKLLSDSNIQDLNRANVNVEPLIFTENKRERFSLFQLLLEPTENLYVSYATSDGVEALAPSRFVVELQNLFTQDGKRLAPVVEQDENVYTKKQAIAKLILNERKLRDNQSVKMPAYTLLMQEFGDDVKKYQFDGTGEVAIQGGKKFYLNKSKISVTRLTDFYSCPYKYFFEYGLYVRPRQVAEMKAVDLGNILHDVLEHYVRDLDENESDETTTLHAEKCFDMAVSADIYKGMTNNGQLVGAMEMLKTEAVRMCLEVKRQLINSDFKNVATELEFGGVGDNGIPPVKVDYDGGTFLLIGKIDRLDAKDGNFIVIDYKSGKTAAEYNEKNLYIGHKLQLLVYVKAVEVAFKDKGYRPVGFYYFNLHDNFTNPDVTTVYKYNGRTIDDLQIIGQLDKGTGKLGITLKNDGQPKKQAKIMRAEQFDNQVEYALKMIEKAGVLMQQGFANVSPYAGTCQYCDFKDVCDFGDVLVYNERKVNGKVTAETIDKAVTEACATAETTGKVVK